MLKNYIKIAWRNLWKHKLLSIINVCGLAIGIATCLIIAMYVADEYSYDRYHQHADRIVRVILKGKVSNEIISEAVTPPPVAKTLKHEFPEVELATRLKASGTPKITFQNSTFRTSRLAHVDPEFFQIFTLPMIKGDPESALDEPNTVVITRQEAKKYFGEEDPLGKVLEFPELNQQYQVTGVIEEVPDNSHFQFDLFATTVGLDDDVDFEWIQSVGYSYLLLLEGTDPADLERKLPAVVEKYMGPQIQQALGMTFEQFEETGNKVGLFLQPLTDIHLRSDFTNPSALEQQGSVKTLFIFSAIALFILFIACINFINLSTSIATKRTKEVGVKKVLGCHKGQLIGQFLMESILISLVALFMAVLLITLTLPYFNFLSGKSLEISSFVSIQHVSILLIFGLITGVVAGVYPAVVLSSFRPIAALKEKVRGAGSQQRIRSGLVVLQFAISVTLIIATLVADLQLSFVMNKELGYNKDKILVLRNSWILGEKERVLQQQLTKDSRIARITRSGFIPAGESNSSMYNIYPNPQSDIFRRTSLYNVDDQYLPTLGMELISGGNFSKYSTDDTSHTIINETAAKLFDLGPNPIGEVITMSTDLDGGKKDLEIIGVVKDFHFKTLYQPIEPLFMLNAPNPGLIIRVSTSDLGGLISSIEKLWNEFDTGEAFSYSMLDESYRKVYSSESNIRSILRVFTVLTIFVAFIGLFGLVTFTTEQKFKEIGVRKVLGSSVMQIITMLTRGFLKLVCLSFLLAFPIAFYLVERGLQEFAYRISTPWWVFAVAALITVALALVTISIRSIKAAMANPVDALRSE